MKEDLLILLVFVFAASFGTAYVASILTRRYPGERRHPAEAGGEYAKAVDRLQAQEERVRRLQGTVMEALRAGSPSHGGGAAVALPMRPFHGEGINDPGEMLKGAGRENPVLRAVMLVVENHLTTRSAEAGAEDAQRFPGVASHRAGAMEAVMTLHGAVCRIVDGLEGFVLEGKGKKGINQ